jgi:PhnB protein
MTFYKDALGADLEILTSGQSPVASQIPAELHSQVMHSRLAKGDLVIMASDNLDGSPVTEGSNLSLMVEFPSEAELRAAFPRLAAGARLVETEPKFEFWGALYGAFVDRYGIRWMFNWEPPKK